MWCHPHLTARRTPTHDRPGCAGRRRAGAGLAPGTIRPWTSWRPRRSGSCAPTTGARGRGRRRACTPTSGAGTPRSSPSAGPTSRPLRAVTELRSLFRGQWSNGMVPQIVFDNGVALGAYEPRHTTWGTAGLCPPSVPTSGICQPPVHAIALARVRSDRRRARRGHARRGRSGRGRPLPPAGRLAPLAALGPRPRRHRAGHGLPPVGERARQLAPLGRRAGQRPDAGRVAGQPARPRPRGRRVRTADRRRVPPVLHARPRAGRGRLRPHSLPPHPPVPHGRRAVHRHPRPPPTTSWPTWPSSPASRPRPTATGPTPS